MKKRLMVLMLAAMVMAFAACGREEDGSGSGDLAASGEDAGNGEVASGRHHVEITVKDYGTISVELDAEAAPITVENFLKLAGEGFYDGLTFHRIMSGFMIQGGDPNGDGTGGSDENIKGEFSENGVENNLSHTRGAISMARAKSPDSASSQFFIVHKDSTYLDGQYACFGYVTEGIEVVDSICDTVDAFIDGNGLVEKESQPVIESIKVVD
ncbi:MAG TPA: peptidylprolyl isomerase [Lachnospiraceae bacterium]|nr:peptidylprolyl isomerase [Lachnospiraceae bacterium]